MNRLKLVKHLNYYNDSSAIPFEEKTILRNGFRVEITPKEKQLCRIASKVNASMPDYSGGFSVPELYNSKMQNVTFFGNSGGILNSQGKIVIESLMNIARMYSSYIFRVPGLFLTSNLKSSSYTSILHLPWAETSIYHFFIDVMPRLYVLSFFKNESITIIINHDVSDFQWQILKTFKVSYRNFKFIKIKRYQKFKISDYVFPSFSSLNNNGYLDDNILTFVTGLTRLAFGTELNINKNRRIYISRKYADKRKLANETEVQKILTNFGFEVVYAEHLNYKMQIELFESSNFIIGVHGAGLTNMIFCSKNTKIIEIHCHNNVNTHYCFMAKSCKLDYSYIIGSKEDKNGYFNIDITLLEKELKEFKIN